MTMSLMEDGVTMASLWYEKAGVEVIDALCDKAYSASGTGSVARRSR